MPLSYGCPEFESRLEDLSWSHPFHSHFASCLWPFSKWSGALQFICTFSRINTSCLWILSYVPNAGKNCHNYTKREVSIDYWFIRVVFCNCIFSKKPGHTHERSSFTLKIIDVTSKYTCTSLVIAIYVICWQHYDVMLNYLKQPNEFTRYLTFGELNQAKVYCNLN